jgi:hypothetical protein
MGKRPGSFEVSRGDACCCYSNPARLRRTKEKSMKHVKILGLLAVAAAALMAFAGVATASTLTSPAGTTYTSTIKASAGSTSLDGSFTTVTCNKSTTEGKVEQHGASVNAGGNVSSLTFSECNFPTKVVKAGKLEITSTSEVISTGAEISIETSVGTCVFTTNNTKVGTFTGGTPASMDIASAKIPRTGGNFLCGSSGTWTGSYTVNTPSTLLVD